MDNMQGYVTVEMDDEFRKLLDIIFNDDFMKAHTNFDNFEGFKYSSAVIANWNADRMVYAELLMDNFVKESTEYATWEEMVKAAADEAFGKP